MSAVFSFIGHKRWLPDLHVILVFGGTMLYLFPFYFLPDNWVVWSSCFLSSRSFPMEFFRFLPTLPFMWDCKGGCDRLVCGFVNMLLIFIFTSPFHETQMVRFFRWSVCDWNWVLAESLLAETHPNWSRWHWLTKGKKLEGRNLFLQEGVAAFSC